MSEQFLSTSIEFLKGVGPKRATVLAQELDIRTYRDLLLYYPFRYIDRTKFYKISEIHEDLPYVQIVGEITYLEETGDCFKKRLVAIFKDETGSIELLWFKGVKFIKSKLIIGEKYVAFAKPTSFRNKLNLVHPDLETLVEYKNAINSTLQPVYHATEKLSRNALASKNISKLTRNLLPQVKGKISENISDYLRAEYKLLSREQAIFNIHYPKNTEWLEHAIRRLKFEELFFIQLNLLKLKQVKLSKSIGYQFSAIGDYVNQFYSEKLPFELTEAQKRVIREIRKDLGSGKQLNRLLQGDVGSGKTIVAIMSMLIALDNGFQACIMAPTEILATQHYESVKELLTSLGVEFALLTGSSKTKERKIIHEKLEDGSLQILIGTHALLEDKVKFKNLGLAVIDEQHRFGVAQRAKLWKKNTHPPHVLIMTATPIPRTLAMTLYGDLDVSVIDELPPGRKDIQTLHWYENKRLRLFGFLEQEIAKGRQIYIVYPLIEESEKLDYANLEEGYQHIFNRFPAPKYKVSIVHGKMKPEVKAFEMNRFINGETDIMVSTTVIEVGVNVPNASVMVIESAERFGLSQLHQLRGRVGRGAEQSYCILMTGNKLSADGRLRMKTMTATNDGFQIAEVDLKLRGPGDLQGTQQSGTPINLKLTNLSTDGEMIALARTAAAKVLASDSDLSLPEHRVIIDYIKENQRGKINWSKIS
ncbi:MAG: ATP-dependent DNA helicase RecG [Bacteroidetes bacterium]|nr:MAG: ATP-dependent DNA helicase RecG [Bacteroidota bacterium]MBL1144199.1 ATP-dependent DNA helicase RecG [Bacteroidota bacterium]NOG56995.1 ATP-dependent DNA helicase RecG [Bacteroidota bacterium]